MKNICMECYKSANEIRVKLWLVTLPTLAKYSTAYGVASTTWRNVGELFVCCRSTGYWCQLWVRGIISDNLRVINGGT